MKLNWLTIGSIIAGKATILGAFGAHAFKSYLENTGRLATYETAVKYQFYHAFALIAVGILIQLHPRHIRSFHRIGLLFVGGITVFSGTLYLLCLTGYTWLGIITPLGGASLISAWFWLAWIMSKAKK